MAVTPQTNTTLAEIADVILDHDDFVICGHVSPDGDCIGSQLALAHALWTMGKKATCILVRDEPVGTALSFMPGVESMIPAASYEGTCEVFVCVDVPTRERIGESACTILDRASCSITIDHHAYEKAMCDYVYVDPDYASASMMVWELVNMLLDTPPLESATCAYVGLVSDTGGFRFQNSDSNAFDAAASLVAYGVDPAYVALNVFENRSIPSLKLESITVDRMEVLADGQVAISWITMSDLDAVRANKTDIEPLIDAVRSVQGVRVACMLREQDGRVRGNLRSKDDTDVSALARELGGGGHRAAAGFTLDMPIGDALAFMKGKLEALFD